MYGSKAVKHLKLAAFAQPYSGNMDCNIRVYVLPDTQDALHVSAGSTVMTLLYNLLLVYHMPLFH